MTRVRCATGMALFAFLPLITPAGGAPVPSEDAKAAVKAYMTRIETGKEADSGPILALKGTEAIAELKPFLTTGTPPQKLTAARMIALIGQRAEAADVRKAAVLALLQCAAGDEPAAPRRRALEGLLAFPPHDFPKAASESIEKLVREADPVPEALLLAAVCEVTRVTDDLKKIIAAGPENPEDSAYKSPRWFAHLALARLGDSDSLKRCVGVIEREKDLVQRARHFHELAFIRRPEAIRVLTDHLTSDERLPQVKPTAPGTKIALYALDALTQHVEGFPIKSEGGPSYTDAQLAIARNWVKEQKELKFKR